MRKRCFIQKGKNIVVYISTALIIIGLIASLIFTKEDSRISSIVTTITAVIGAVALYIQFKKDKEINNASFIVEFHNSFYESEQNKRMLALLDAKYDGEKVDFSNKQTKKDILSYFGWIRSLCNLIEKNVLTFDSIDDNFAYKFFMIINNKQVQDLELVPNARFYAIFYRIHKKWEAYRTRHHQQLICPEESLALTEPYQKLSNSK